MSDAYEADWDTIPNPPRYYDIDREPITLRQWTELFGNIKYRRIGLDRIHDRWVVSTVWLGLDHSFPWPDRPRIPLIFETMVFDDHEEEPLNRIDLRMERYTTKQQAIGGHRQMIAEVQGWDPESTKMSDT